MQRPPSPDLRQATYAHLDRIAANGGQGMSGLSSAELRTAPWVIFEPFGEDAGAIALAARDGVLPAYLRELFRRGKASAVAALIHCFLLFYPQRLPLFEQLREVIPAQLLPRVSGGRIARWRGCADQCGLFAADAPIQLAARLAQAEEAPDLVLERCCLAGQLTTGEFAREAFSRFLAATSSQLRTASASTNLLERLLSLSRRPDDARRFRFERDRFALVNGLLLPFAEGSPGPAVAEPIKAFMLDMLGDPRLTGTWNGADPRARQVMLGWMVTQTLEDFFRLLEYAANSDATARRHWAARKTFWSRYLRAGVIADAWVALGPVARIEARDMLSGSGQTYAVLKPGYNVQKNHSAIVMRIGNLVITEWSHSGSFRAWRSDAPACPRLYQDTYTRRELVTNPVHELAHYSGWQSRVADLIYDETGIRS
ncbi:EH signature domain-containing protein [uncultured Thiohalocapsa sp.]|uniref:EH signature domain-containing protein n=1 Tax=uncultured Thiohalocapsa sp. TaxID=768990 RepID=UPI0025E2BEE8|nr:EH signature domain-containing protein [uncultured Thiohalocapsa sp.]